MKQQKERKKAMPAYSVAASLPKSTILFDIYPIGDLWSKTTPLQYTNPIALYMKLLKYTLSSKRA